MPKEVDPNVLAALKDLFDEVDSDKSGAIDFPEMIEMLKELNIKNPDFFTTLIWFLLKKEVNASLSFEEFKVFFLGLKHVDHIPDIIAKMLFISLDTDHSGSVELNEFMVLLQNLAVMCPFERMKEIFNSCDKDKSGSLELKEFKRFIRKAATHPIFIA